MWHYIWAFAAMCLQMAGMDWHAAGISTVWYCCCVPCCSPVLLRHRLCSNWSITPGSWAHSSKPTTCCCSRQIEQTVGRTKGQIKVDRPLACWNSNRGLLLLDGRIVKTIKHGNIFCKSPCWFYLHQSNTLGVRNKPITTQVKFFLNLVHQKYSKSTCFDLSYSILVTQIVYHPNVLNMLHRYPLPKYKIPKRFLAKHLEITAITTGAGAEIAAI